MERSASTPGPRAGRGNGSPKLRPLTHHQGHTRSSAVIPVGSEPFFLTLARSSSLRTVRAANEASRGDAWAQSTARQAGPECAECDDCYNVVPLRDMRRHRREECPERPVACPNAGCGAAMVAAALPAHLRSECAHAARGKAMAARGRERSEPQPCRLNCGRTVAPADRNPHEELECPRRTVRCYACGRRVRLSDLRQHLKRSCPVGVRREELARAYAAHADQRNRCPRCERVLGGNVAPSAMKRHLAEACPRRQLACPLPGCGLRFEARHAGRHAREACAFTLGRERMAASARQREAASERCAQCRRSVRALDMRRHRAELCPRRPVRCPNDGCGAEVAEEDLRVHLEYSCPAAVLRDELAERAALHYEEAPCPRRCGVSLRRCDLPAHLEGPCRRRQVPCPNAALGCAALVQQRDLPLHLREGCAVERRRARLADLHDEHTAPAPCPLACGATLPARRVDEHMREHCPRRPERCPHCGEEVRHADTEYHLRRLCPGDGPRRRRLLQAFAREKYPPPHVLPPPDKSRRERLTAKRRARRKPVWL